MLRNITKTYKKSRVIKLRTKEDSKKLSLHHRINKIQESKAWATGKFCAQDNMSTNISSKSDIGTICKMLIHRIKNIDLFHGIQNKKKVLYF